MAPPPRQRLRIIILPMLLPAVFLALVLRTMDAFRVFDIVFATTNGGPADATDVLMIYGVKQGLQFFNIGFASAIANMMIALHRGLSRSLFIVLVRRADRRANELADEPPRADRASLPPSAPALVVDRRDLPAAGRLADHHRLQAGARHLQLPADPRLHPDARQFPRRVPLFRPARISSRAASSSRLGSVALSLLIGIPAGYALARSRSRATRSAVAYFFLAIRTVPPVATLIPFYLMMRDIGLLGTWWAVILINATLNSAFVVWMMFSYFRSLPKELEEAALTDGCTLFGSFFRVALPLVIPGIVASALLCVMFSWNDFIYAAFLTRAETKPISVALLAAYGTKDITWGTLGALAHFSTIPIVLIALCSTATSCRGSPGGFIDST